MTRFVTSRLNAYSRQGFAIEDDRPCAKCKYNLRGLTTSGRCPECGTPITTYADSTSTASGRKKARTMDFCDLPPSLIRKFSIGFYLAALTLIGILALVFTSFRWGITNEEYAGAITILSVLWFPAVWLMTSPLDIPYEQRLGAPWEMKVRFWTRWLQVGWIVNAIMAWAKVSTLSPGGPLFTAAQLITEFAGVLGVVLLCLLLANFSAWVRDEFAERCFNYTIGGIVIISPLLFFGATLVMTVLPMAIVAFIFLWFIWVGALVAFPIGMWSLGRTMSWAVRHSKDRLDRATEFADSLAPEPAPGAGGLPKPSEEPIPLDEASEHHEIRHGMSISATREHYDHERGAGRSHGDATPQADLF